MMSIEISVKKGFGRLLFDGIRVTNGAWALDTRKVQVRVRKQCAIAEWANDCLDRGLPFVIDYAQMPNLQRNFKRFMKHKTRPVVYEGVYTSWSGVAFRVLKPVNGSSWRVLLGMEYFKMFDEAGLCFESPLPVGRRGGDRLVSDALRLVTVRGALCGFLMPCWHGISMWTLRKVVVKNGPIH